MAQGYMSPLPTFTLESLVAFRQWSAEQRFSKKKPNPAKAERKAARPLNNGSKSNKRAD